MPPSAKRGARTARPRRVSQARNRIRPVPDRPKIEITVEDLADFNESVNILLYGNSGVGKTVLAAFAPNAYFLSTEKGVVSAKRVGSEAKLIRATNWEHTEAGLDWADENLGADDWVIIDSGSKMQILMLRWWLGIQHEENEGRDMDVPQIQDHQKWQNMYMRFYDRIVDADWNSIMIATAMHKTDEEGDSLILPAITGKDYTISNYCCAQADMVLYLGVARQSKQNKDQPTIRRVLSETFPPWFAKDRYHVLPRWIDIEEEDFLTMPWIIGQVMEVPGEERRAVKAGHREGRRNAQAQAN